MALAADSSRSLRYRRGSLASLGPSLFRAGGGGEGGGDRRGGPDAEAVEAVPRLPDPAVAGSAAETDDPVGRSVPLDERVRDAPRGEGADEEAGSEAAVLHGRSLAAARHRRVTARRRRGASRPPRRESRPRPRRRAPPTPARRRRAARRGVPQRDRPARSSP